MIREKKLEALLWSIALPGFAQLLNKQIFKGTVFIILEFLVNVNSNFNTAIMLSFLGEIDGAIKAADYQWLMFYPCLYMFAMWDAYKFSSGEKIGEYAFLPFVFGAYFVTVGLMFSKKMYLFGMLFGPVWLPIAFLPLGLLVGHLIRLAILFFTKTKTVL